MSNDETNAAPLDCPITVILFGSPPKYLIYFLTHFNANNTSNAPALPGISAVFVDKKPDVETTKS